MYAPFIVLPRIKTNPLLLVQIKIRINTDMPVQVDGEPWIQSPGEVVILKSALRVCV